MEEEVKELNGKEAISLAFEGVIVGIFAGLAVILYRLIIDSSVEWISEFYQSANLLKILPLLVIFFIFSFIAIYFIKWAPLSGGSGIPQIVGEIQGKFNMNPFKVIISKFVGGTLSALGGLSMGREGPSVQIGGACGKIVSKLLKRKDREKVLISAGAGAGLAGAFCAPLSGVMITLEEFTKTFNPFIFIPTFTACLVTAIISKLIFGLNLLFSFTIVEHIPMKIYIHVIILGVFVGLIGVIYNEGLQYIQKQMKKLPFGPGLQVYFAFIIAIIIGMTFPSILGGGHALVEKLNTYHGSLNLLILLIVLKLLFTALCFGTGIQGGTLVPMLAIGALSGAIYFYLVNSLDGFSIQSAYYTNFLVLGMAAMLASVMRSSLTSIMIVFEMTGSYAHLTAFILVVIISYIVAEVFKSKPFFESLLDKMLVKI